MNVAHLISSNGLFGAEKVLLGLAQRQNQGSDRSWVGAVRNLSNPHLEIVEEAERKGFPHFVVESRGRLDLKASDILASFLQNNAIDILHTHNYKANLIGLIAARKAGVPIVATNHLWTMADWKLRFYESVDAFLFRRFFKKIVAVSEGIRKDMMAKGVPAERIVVIPNGVDIPAAGSDRAAARQRFGIAESALVMGVIARLSPEKGHVYLFEAIKMLTEDGKNIKLLVVGDGPEKRVLELRVSSFGLKDKVVFAGYQKDMESVYAAIDILVQPSLREGLPMTLLEAMARRKAVIATRVGGVPSLIKDGENGLLVDPASPASLERAIIRLMQDKELRVRFGERGQAFVREFYSLDGMAAAYERVYREVLKP